MFQSALFILISVWILLSILLYLFQPGFIYYPYKKVEVTPAAIQLKYEDVFLTTSDNIKLNGWWIPRLNSRATLLFLHGNAGNISHRLDSIKIFHDLGLSVFIIDYRGYGNSEGKPSEKGTYLDAEAAWQYLVNEKNIASDEIIVFGRSLGGAVASWLATKHTVAGLILESTFTSIEDMGRHYYPYLPVKFLARIKYPTLKRISQVNSPVLVIHSPDDDIVPYQLGKKLFVQANEPKQFLNLTGGHNEGFLSSGNLYIQGLNNFLNSIFSK